MNRREFLSTVALPVFAPATLGRSRNLSNRLGSKSINQEILESGLSDLSTFRDLDAIDSLSRSLEAEQRKYDRFASSIENYWEGVPDGLSHLFEPQVFENQSRLAHGLKHRFKVYRYILSDSIRVVDRLSLIQNRVVTHGSEYGLNLTEFGDEFEILEIAHGYADISVQNTPLPEDVITDVTYITSTGVRRIQKLRGMSAMQEEVVDEFNKLLDTISAYNHIFKSNIVLGGLSEDVVGTIHHLERGDIDSARELFPNNTIDIPTGINTDSRLETQSDITLKKHIELISLHNEIVDREIKPDSISPLFEQFIQNMDASEQLYQ